MYKDTKLKSTKVGWRAGILDKNSHQSPPERIANQINSILMGEEGLPEWMTHGHTVFCQKDPTKSSAAENFRPITSLHLCGNFYLE